jgi:glycosyltransferase involved in cell wall biosynthesis
LVAGFRSWGVPTEALFLRGRYAYSDAGSARDKVAALLSKQAIQTGEWESRWHLDPLCADYLRARSVPVKRMPEPVEPMCDVARGEARLRLGLPPSSLILGVLGSLDRRKGVLELLEAFRRSGVQDLMLALLGKLDPEIRDSVHELAARCPRGSVVVRDALLSPDEFTCALAACDWQSVVYPRHFGSSGVLVRAAAVGRPVLASDFGWVGEATRRYGLGLTCDASSVDAIAERVHTIQKQPSFALGSDRASFVTFNTEANFIAHWGVTLRARLGLPPDETLFELP